jgi:hypothetical protein
MRQAYILKLGSETDPAKCHFAGSIEEVDTGRELRFKSTEELLAFLAECFEKSTQEGIRGQEPDEPLTN